MEYFTFNVEGICEDRVENVLSEEEGKELAYNHLYCGDLENVDIEPIESVFDKESHVLNITMSVSGTVTCYEDSREKALEMANRMNFGNLESIAVTDSEEC